ncbi:MAG: hypothetical protein ACRDWA_09005 [Acidimicrobiia bacterium]
MVRTVSGTFESGFVVPEGEKWQVIGTAEAARNVLVLGTLVMRPGSTLRFVGVDESAFVGEGMDPLDSDIGLWVMGNGQLDIEGTRKVAWNRSGADPSWGATDELVITPTEPESLSCRAYQAGDPVPQAYGDVPPAEVVNLSRDVSIEGTPGRRSHIFIRSTRPQTIKFAQLRHLGPHKDGEVVEGRWPLHFHHAGDGSRGSRVEGVVVRDAGSHAFVPHASHGIAFTSCVAYDVATDAFWWDQGEVTHDTSWDRCLVANLRAGPERSLKGFLMHPHGNGNQATNCVVAGSDDQGFGWPVGVPQSGVWRMEGNVAHNCKREGVRWWANQIGREKHGTTDFLAYNVGAMGLFQGAYKNSVRHVGPKLRGCEMEFHASGNTSDGGRRQGADNADIDVVGRRDHALVLSGSQKPSSEPTLFQGCSFRGSAVSAVGVRVNHVVRAWDFVGCTRDDGLDLEVSDFTIYADRRSIDQQSWLIRVLRSDGSAFEFGPDGLVDTISAFALV